MKLMLLSKSFTQGDASERSSNTCTLLRNGPNLSRAWPRRVTWTFHTTDEPLLGNNERVRDPSSSRDFSSLCKDHVYQNNKLVSAGLDRTSSQSAAFPTRRFVPGLCARGGGAGRPRGPGRRRNAARPGTRPSGRDDLRVALLRPPQPQQAHRSSHEPHRHHRACIYALQPHSSSLRSGTKTPNQLQENDPRNEQKVTKDQIPQNEAGKMTKHKSKKRPENDTSDSCL